jgi:hypothetical protein
LQFKIAILCGGYVGKTLLVHGLFDHVHTGNFKDILYTRPMGYTRDMKGIFWHLPKTIFGVFGIGFFRGFISGFLYGFKCTEGIFKTLNGLKSGCFLFHCRIVVPVAKKQAPQR